MIGMGLSVYALVVSVLHVALVELDVVGHSMSGRELGILFLTCIPGSIIGLALSIYANVERRRWSKFAIVLAGISTLVSLGAFMLLLISRVVSI